jgi:hypothetical protein
VARTIAAVGHALTPRRRVVILRQAGVIRPRAVDILLLRQAVRTRPRRIHRRRLAMDRLAGAGVLRVAAVEAEAAQDRTAGKSSIKSKRKGLLSEQAFFMCAEEFSCVKRPRSSSAV